jgi:hypothetical protein
MKYSVSVSESANEDAIVIFDWYEKKLKELGDRFITELEIAKVDLLKTIWLLLYGIKASGVW